MYLGWIVVISIVWLGAGNEKGRWDFPAASVRILDVGV